MFRTGIECFVHTIAGDKWSYHAGSSAFPNTCHVEISINAIK
jgi:hypothetical protein